MYKQCWSGLIPSNPDQTAILAEHFFNCVCGLMARQLRGTVENSLQDFVSFFSLYQEGNDYHGEFHDVMFVSPPVSDRFCLMTMLTHSHFLSFSFPPLFLLLSLSPCSQALHIELIVKGSELLFKPPFSELDGIVRRLIITIVESGQKLPRVEHVLFPDLEGYDLFIPHMELGEVEVDQARKQALSLLRANFAGPKKYLEQTYTQYHSLMDGNASLEVDNFLKHSDNELPAFGKVQLLIKRVATCTLCSCLASNLKLRVHVQYTAPL